LTEPFQDREIAGTEPLYYTYREEDGYITRYCAMLGMNDPLCLFLGNYDRMCMVTGKWTEMPVIQEDKGNYIKIELDDKKLPTIGANGFLVRRDALMGCSTGDYLFDIDIVYELITQRKNKFAKVKVLKFIVYTRLQAAHTISLSTMSHIDKLDIWRDFYDSSPSGYSP